MPKLFFLGTVFSGRGEGKKFVELPWVKRQIEKKFGFNPYFGTLNLRLTQESIEKKGLIKNANGIKVEPQNGYCPGLLFKAYIGTLECAVVVPKVPNYPKDILEVISPVFLREELKLVDGCKVAVSVNV